MRWSIVQTTPPDAEPISLDEAKAQSRLDADLTDEDTLLAAYIAAARGAIENETGRQLVTATYELRLDAFPRRERYMAIPRPPLQSVESIVYLDSSGAPQTMDEALYAADTASDPGVIALASTASWPATLWQRNAVTITYMAGYGDEPTAVPGPLRAALLLWVAALYEQREDMSEKPLTQFPLGVQRLIYPYRLASVLVA